MGFKWNFKTVTNHSYVMLLELKADSAIISKLCRLSQSKFSLRKQIQDHSEEFLAPPSYLGTVHRFVRKLVNKVAREVKKDGVFISTERVTECRFRPDSVNGWDILIKVEGLYIEK